MSAPSTTSVIFDAPGPRGRRIGVIVGLLGVVVLFGVVAALVWALRDQLLVAKKWEPFAEGETWTAYILPGLWSTLKAAFIAILLAGAFGIVFGVGRLAHNRLIRGICGVVVEFFRSVPVLVMMVFFYYVGMLQWGISGDQLPQFAVVLGLTFYNGSVMAELIRSGVGSLPRGQEEAALALGLSRGQTLISVLLPQAITAMLPSLLSQLVVVVKDTALGYIVTYPDLLRSVYTLASARANVLPSLIVAALIYILINYALTWAAGRLERGMRTRRAGRAVTVGIQAPPAH